MSRLDIHKGVSVVVWLLAALLLIGSVYAFRRAWASSRSTAKVSQSQGSGPVVRLVKNPQKMPSFAVHDLAGNPISSADFSGKVVLVNF